MGRELSESAMGCKMGWRVDRGGGDGARATLHRMGGREGIFLCKLQWAANISTRPNIFDMDDCPAPGAK